MKKYCVISFCNLYYLPYASEYIKSILQSGGTCDLLFWDRDANGGAKDVYPGCRKIIYEKLIDSYSNKGNLLIGYIGARKKFIRHLRKEQYEGLVFLQTQAAVACSGILRKYNGRYIIDIRDYSYENNSLYFRIEKRIVDNSYANVISSPYYTKFLPVGRYVVSHNFTPLGASVNGSSPCSNRPIRISYVGTVRFFEMDKKVLDAFSNDTRFIICYYGRGSEILEDYCNSKGIKNVEFYGAFGQSMTMMFYNNTDLINNLYGNNNPFLDFALSNKLYHAAQLCVPILVCPNTAMAELSTEYGFGYIFDVNDKDAVDNLYDWFFSIDREKMRIGCSKFIKRVTAENKQFICTIERFLNEKNR